MDVCPNPEQSAILETARSFAKKSIEAEKYDALNAPFPDECLKAAWELGFATAAVPCDCGGLGAGFVAQGIVLEELAASCAGIATACLGAAAGQIAVAIAGRGKISLPDSGDGRLNATIVGLPEVSIEEVSGKFLAGKAGGVIGAGNTASYVVPAKNGSETVLFLVPANNDSVKIEVSENPLGLRAAKLGRVMINRVPASDAKRVGEIDPDLLLAIVAPLQGCVAVGLARGALQAAENYARERYQGGDNIIRHDTVAHMILGNRAAINASRANIRAVLASLDNIFDMTTGAMTGSPDVVEAVLSRTFATDACLKAALDAMQVFGGYGFMKDYPVEKRLRDARSIGVVFGSAPELLTHIKGRIEE